MKGWYFIIIGIVVMLTLVAAIVYALRPVPIVQPIQINHKIHLESEPPGGQEKITCKTCHKYYDTRMVAGRPSIETCLSCHTTSSKKEEERPELDKLLEFGKSGKEVSWKRIYDVPDHVFFSHQRHTGTSQQPLEGVAAQSRKTHEDEDNDNESGKQIQGSIKCEICHGPIAETVTPPPAPLNEITMEFCIDCHKQENATEDCIACHR